MRELIRDAAAWKIKDDIFLSFFKVVEAPSWHGKNFDALWDSIRSRQINKIDAPYRLVFRNYDLVDANEKNDAERFIELVYEAAASGIPIETRTETAN